MTANTKSKTVDKPATGAKVTPAKEAETHNQAHAEAQKIKDDATTKAVEILKEAHEEAVQIKGDAQADANDIIGKANAQADNIIDEAGKDAEVIVMRNQREKDDLSNGKIDPDAEQQAYRNEGKNNLFTEGGRCRPNETVMLTLDQADQYAGLAPCRKDSE